MCSGSLRTDPVTVVTAASAGGAGVASGERGAQPVGPAVNSSNSVTHTTTLSVIDTRPPCLIVPLLCCCLSIETGKQEGLFHK